VTWDGGGLPPQRAKVGLAGDSGLSGPPARLSPVELRYNSADLKQAWRILGPFVAGWICGNLGVLPVLIFGPLLFPLSLDGRAKGENILFGTAILFFLFFGAMGFRFVWKRTRQERSEAEDRITSIKV